MKSKSAVAEPETGTATRTREKQDKKPKRQPRYHVVLWDDDDHSYDYVIRMMRELFGHTIEKGMQISGLKDRPKWVESSKHIWEEYYSKIGYGDYKKGKELVEKVLTITME